MKILIVEIEPLPICEEEALLMYLNDNGIEFSEIEMKPSEDSGEFLSDSWLEIADIEYEKNRDEESI